MTTPTIERFVCSECGRGVNIERTASGGAFTVVARFGVPEEATFGMGADGDPLCPAGHGAMLPDGVDDTDPGEVPTEQGELFDRSTPFNFEGAYLEIERLTLEADALAKLAERDKKRAADSKKEWEEAARVLHAQIVELRRRRIGKLRVEAPDDEPVSEAPIAEEPGA